MACDPNAEPTCFLYPSGTIPCGGAKGDDYPLGYCTTMRYEITCRDCLIAMKEFAEYCWRCCQPDPNHPQSRYMRHTCDPGDYESEPYADERDVI